MKGLYTWLHRPRRLGSASAARLKYYFLAVRTVASYLTFLSSSFLMWTLDIIKVPKAWGCLVMVTGDNSCILRGQNILGTAPVVAPVLAQMQASAYSLPTASPRSSPGPSGTCPHVGTAESQAMSLGRGLTQLRMGQRVRCLREHTCTWQILFNFCPFLKSCSLALASPPPKLF